MTSERFKETMEDWNWVVHIAFCFRWWYWFIG